MEISTEAGHFAVLIFQLHFDTGLRSPCREAFWGGQTKLCHKFAVVAVTHATYTMPASTIVHLVNVTIMDRCRDAMFLLLVLIMLSWSTTSCHSI